MNRLQFPDARPNIPLPKASNTSDSNLESANNPQQTHPEVSSKQALPQEQANSSKNQSVTNNQINKSNPNLLRAINAKGTILLLDTCSTDAAHKDLLKYLHRGFFEKGWNTAVLQHKAELAQQIQALNQTFNSSIILLAHGCDNQLLINQASKRNSGVSTYIALGMPNEIRTKTDIKALTVPMLDIEGKVTRQIERWDMKWAKKLQENGGKKIELPSTNNDFIQHEDQLIFLISDWLRTW